MQTLNLISIYLPPDYSANEIADVLETRFKKGIEATHYSKFDQKRWLFFCQFDVLTFVNWNRLQIIDVLERLGLENSNQFEEHFLNQDYLLEINPEISSAFQISHQKITLQELNSANLMVAALVISQSVGLERFENDVDAYYTQGRQMMESAGRYSWMRRKQFSDYAKAISLLKHDMVLDLMLLDKPDILWDNEQLEQLYNQLAEHLELKARFDILSYKLNTLKDDIAMMMELYHHKHSSFLEWIIILLILFEVIMGLGEHFHWF